MPLVDQLHLNKSQNAKFFQEYIKSEDDLYLLTESNLGSKISPYHLSMSCRIFFQEQLISLLRPSSFSSTVEASFNNLLNYQ